MSRLPLRSPRIKPPLRGRLAAHLPAERQGYYSSPVTRPRPAVAKSKNNKSVSQNLIKDMGENLEHSIQPQPESINSVTPEDHPSKSPEPQTPIISWIIGLAIAILLFLLLK